MATFPEQFILPKKLRIRSLDSTQTDPTLGGISNKNRIAYRHRWAFDMTTPKLNYERAMALYAFICSMGGRFGVCTMKNPLPQLGAGAENALVRTSAEQGDTTTALYAMNNNVLGALKAGDYIQFDNHTKAYMVTAVLNTNGVGQGTVSFTPNLRIAVPAGTPMKSGGNVHFSLELKSDDQDIQHRADTDREVAIKVEFEEYIND